jgi:hypothetical protein
MAKDFPGWIMPSPIRLYPRNSVHEMREKEIAAKAAAPADHGRTGGSRKQANARPLQELAYGKVSREFRVWLAKKEFTNQLFEIWWDLHRQRVYDAIANTNAKAAKLLCCGPRSKKFLPARLIDRRIRAFEARIAPRDGGANRASPKNSEK